MFSERTFNCLFELKVGLMRDGRLLAESPPEDLLRVHNLQVVC